MRAARRGRARARCEVASAVQVCAARGPGRLTQSRSGGRAAHGFAFWKTTRIGVNQMHADDDKSSPFPARGLQGGRQSAFAVVLNTLFCTSNMRESI